MCPPAPSGCHVPAWRPIHLISCTCQAVGRARSRRRAPRPPHEVHDRRAGKVDVTMTETEFLSKRRQPATAPNPVGEKRVDHHRHEEPEDDERRELPALGHRAGRDRAGGIHEHHLEEEEREHADVVGVAAQEEALHAEEAEGVAEETNGEVAIEGRGAPKHAQSAEAADLQCVAAVSTQMPIG